MRLSILFIVACFISIQAKAQQVNADDSLSANKISASTQKGVKAERPYPVNFSHFGVTVPNLEKAVEFYTDVFGWYKISGPVKVKEKGNNKLSKVSRGLYGKGWDYFRFSHLATAGGIGFEIFEFSNNSTKRSTDSVFKTGFSHVAVQTPNVKQLLQRIQKYGGKQTSKIFHLTPGKDGYKLVYAEDPFGNKIEIYSHAYILQTE
ncbi:MAG TPA: VOC family protein, partial [Balneolaceae bacterium]|nr:VOC family protein [Balneolaceae bacterium]